MHEVLESIFNYLAQFPHETLTAVAISILFFGSILEALPVGVFIPMETSAVLLGVFSYRGLLDIKILIISVFVGMVTGDTLEYLFGKRVGEEYIKKHFKKIKVDERRFRKIKIMIKKNIFKALFLGRSSSWTRWMVPFISGAHKINVKKFFVYDIISASIWAPVYLLGGYYIGLAFEQFEEYLGVVIVLLLLILFTRYAIAKRRADVKY